ncbi:unnamed protein product, partial [Prorocentrum cordatum]
AMLDAKLDSTLGALAGEKQKGSGGARRAQDQVDPRKQPISMLVPPSLEPVKPRQWQAQPEARPKPEDPLARKRRIDRFAAGEAKLEAKPEDPLAKKRRIDSLLDTPLSEQKARNSRKKQQ